MKDKNLKNDTIASAEQIIMSKIDIKGGKMTFSQRIELGKIFQSEDTEVQKFEKTFHVLHKYTPDSEEYTTLMEYFQSIVGGIVYWIESETNLLKADDPSPDEIQAGIKELSASIGEFGTVKAIAKTYGKDPDEILQWDYGKIFGILYTDLEEHKYQKRLNKIIELKYKKP